MNKNSIAGKAANHTQTDLDRAVVLFHLQRACKYLENIQEGMLILRKIPENENETREAIAMYAADTSIPKVSGTPSSDAKFFRFMEAFDSENRKVKLEMVRIKEQIKKESQILFLIKNAVISLRKPEKKVIYARYFEKKSWKTIQKELDKSESYTFQLHVQGLKSLAQSFSKENMAVLRESYMMDSFETEYFSYQFAK